MNPEQAVQPDQNQAVLAKPQSPVKKPAILIFIIILILAIGVFYYFMLRRENSTPPPPLFSKPVPEITASPTAVPVAANLDSSDTQLDKDIEAINNKVNKLVTDVNNVDQGLSDKPLDTGQ